MSKEKLISMHTYCSAALRKRVALAALERDMSVSELVNKLLMEWLEKVEGSGGGLDEQEEKD